MRVSDLQPAAYPQSPSVELPNQDAHRLFTNDFNKNSFIEDYEMLRLFGTNDTSIGKSQPLPKVVRLTVSLNNVLVILGGVNNGFCSI